MIITQIVNTDVKQINKKTNEYEWTTEQAMTKERFVEVVKKLNIHIVSDCLCNDLPDGEIAISSKALTNPDWKD